MSLALPRGTTRPIVWSIAGSDPCAGAGIQADLKTMTALGAHGCTIITSLTAQNSASVQSFESVSPAMLKAQMDALHSDMPPRAIKIGMLGNAESVQVLADALRRMDIYTVYDPVLISSSGTRLQDDQTLAAMREHLLPHVDLLTPNLAEAEALSGISIKDDAAVEQAAKVLLQTGITSILIKGWDSGDGFVQDYYRSATTGYWLSLPRYTGEIPRGTGCTMASALATAHAFGFEEADAVVIAKAYVHRLLRQSHKLGAGKPLAEHQAWPAAAEDFPWLTPTAKAGRHRPVFPDCGKEPLGFYPVVESVAWLRRLLPLGVSTAQLRVKNLQGEALEQEIRDAIAVGRHYGVRLFINDYWQLALKHNAYGVHLGQEDLECADIPALAASGLRLGISTHGYAEAARAVAFNPSYIALGPIFLTTLKSMAVAPQGIETLRIWRSLFSCPLVAIGGITFEKAPEILAAGADSIAVVSDVTQNADPEARVRAWLELTEMRKRPQGDGFQLSAFA